MSAYQTPPPSREQNQKRTIDIVRIGHDTLLEEHRKVQEAVLGIYNFQSIPSNIETGKVFQYELENQQLYQAHEVILISATASFLPVINMNKEQLFKLEMQVPTDYDIEYKDRPAPTPDQPQSWKEKLGFGGKKKRVISNTDPYQEGLPYLKEIMSKLERLERFTEMQSYGVDLAHHTSYKGMMNYLQFHRTRFKFDIAPAIIRLHKQYIDLVLKEEKIGAIKIASKLDDEIFKTRNDFMKQ